MYDAIDKVKYIDDNMTTNILATLQESARVMLSSLGSVVSAPGLSNSISNDNSMSSIYNITADFPNATDKDSILAAFDNLKNLASQYANRR